MQFEWQPSATFENLRIRAHFLKLIRDFFEKRKVMEVETPLLCRTSVTDPFIQSIPAHIQAHPHAKTETYYLQTSPEYAMKRLLAAGSGSIFQITKAFRQGEVGQKHNPEFTMLEWYRVGFDHHQLMDEMDDFLHAILNTKKAERKSYAALFEQFLNIDPHLATLIELKNCALQNHIVVNADITDRNTWLDLLLTHVIEPKIGLTTPIFIYDFPASQAALARLQPTEPPVASRFEVYFKGMELANGFHELKNGTEQRKRFEKNLLSREQLQLAPLPLDEFFLSALNHGLPDCAGVALGIDRLLMLATQSTHIKDVISFDFGRV